MSQIGLPLDWSGRGTDGQFLVSDANIVAVRHIEQWRQWPIPVSILTGPARSGRSTLAQQFAALSGGTVIDDAQHRAEADLFHAWNVARDTDVPLLLVGDDEPAAWRVALPDLRSRLSAAPHVRIGQPDDALVAALIEQGLAAAGSTFSPELPAWVGKSTERSYDRIAAIITLLNRLSISSNRKISVPFAKEALRDAGFLPILASEQGSAAADEG